MRFEGSGDEAAVRIGVALSLALQFGVQYGSARASNTG
jgi:hypothetical protein